MAPSALPLIVNLAPTGAVADAGKNAAVPISANAIVADVQACARLGAAMIHLHAVSYTHLDVYKRQM